MSLGEPTMNVPRVMAALALCLTLLSVNAAQAEDAAALKEKVTTYTVSLAKLEQADKDLQSAVEDIALARLWLDDAKTFLSKEEEDRASLYLRRVEFSLEMIENIIETAKVQKTAFDRESASLDMEKQAFEAKAALEKAELLERKLMTEVTGAGTKTPDNKPDAGNGGGK